MKPLSAYALKQIDAHDYEAFRQYPDLRNRTRFYKWLVRAGNDVQVRTVAVKSRKDRTACIKEVVRGSVDDAKLYVKDVALVPMSGYVVDWHREKCGRRQQFDYQGHWGDFLFTYKVGFRMQWIEPINTDLLKRVKRFKWCAYKPECGDILGYLKLYTKHPRIEMLSKLGLGRFAQLSGFVKQLDSDKSLMRFFSKHIEEIKAKYYTVDVIRMAHRRGITLGEAYTIKCEMRMFHGIGLPKDIDVSKAYAYVKAHDDNEFAYCNYIQDCMKMGMNLSDTKVAFPKRFKARAKIVKEMVAEVRRREKIEEQKKMDANIAAVSKKLAKLEAVAGPFKVVIPRREQDFRNEGKSLHHCIGNGCYVSGHAKGEHVIAFIRRARSLRVPFVTLQFSPESGKVNQCYGKNNSKPEKRVLDFIHGAFTKAAKRIVAKAI